MAGYLARNKQAWLAQATVAELSPQAQDQATLVVLQVKLRVIPPLLTVTALAQSQHPAVPMSVGFWETIIAVPPLAMFTAADTFLRLALRMLAASWVD